MNSVLCKCFGYDWSWGLTIRNIIRALPDFYFITEEAKRDTRNLSADMIWSQQVTVLPYIPENRRGKTVCRLGGNRSFDEEGPVRNRFEEAMRTVYGIVATNTKLYNIAKAVNENTWLIPNGLDINEWCPVPGKRTYGFTVGFVGNIQAAIYREYKGYDLVAEACKAVRVTLKNALYRQGQIPHELMREKFYGKISILVHPTKGEGCSNAIMEALSCGIPVVTTREAGYHGERLVDGENVLFCERTVESVQGCIARLKADSKLRRRLSENGRKFAVEHHDITKIATQYREIFLACIAANKKQEQVLKKETSDMVTVRFERSTVEPEEGFIEKGTVLDISRLRARQLGDVVTILEEVKDGSGAGA